MEVDYGRMENNMIKSKYFDMEPLLLQTESMKL